MHYRVKAAYYRDGTPILVGDSVRVDPYSLAEAKRLSEIETSTDRGRVDSILSRSMVAVRVGPYVIAVATHNLDRRSESCQTEYSLN